MRRQEKKNNSNILDKNLEYKQSGDNSELRLLLFNEQKGFCAYTETYLGRSDQKDIDHFNPSKDFQSRNNYNNLFLCKALWNKEKSSKWDKYQPILLPTNNEFEERVVYNKDLKIFEAKNENDIEANNIVEILKLDDPDLCDERKRYLRRTLDYSVAYGISIQEFFIKLISEKHFEHISFIRSCQEEFGIDIWNIIPEIED